ncbi:MAG: TIR domain-containing protein [Ectothiorhodospiraceae bacterium AqS1]|nr:TIR domain-containing protein [Ectothiorhodospiraceae bacterium AqS1]
MTMTKAFVSYHHENDQKYKNYLLWLAMIGKAFEDISVKMGDIDNNLSSETIREIIRDDYLRDSQVTILLCGTETRFRKHIDWELKSSMIDGKRNRKSGILVINLPNILAKGWNASLPGEKEIVYRDYTGGWTNVWTKGEYQSLYPYMPERIIDNLLMPSVSISVVPWSRIENRPEVLKWLVDASAQARYTNKYDLRLPMRRQNYNPNPYPRHPF